MKTETRPWWNRGRVSSHTEPMKPKPKRILLWTALLVIPLSLVWAASPTTSMVTSKTDGLHVCTKATDKLAFYDLATAIVQPAATVCTREALQTLGLMAADGTTTASATAGAATLNKTIGVITSEALTTVAQAAYTLTLTNSTIKATSVVTASVDWGTNNQGWVFVSTITCTSGQAVIKVFNMHASASLNGTIKIAFVVNK